MHLEPGCSGSTGVQFKHVFGFLRCSVYWTSKRKTALARRSIAPDLNDVARTIEPNDIERQKTPVHPMAMMAGLLIDKEHAAILRKRIPIHEASR